MTGTEIKAWRLKRKIELSEWSTMLRDAGLIEQSWWACFIETKQWEPGWGTDYTVCVRSEIVQAGIVGFIRGYEAGEKT